MAGRKIADVARWLAASCGYNAGAFYGSASSASIGVGLVYERVRYPFYQPETELWDVAEGAAYVLTHECDVAQDNERFANTDVLICPLEPADVVLEECAGINIEVAESFAASLASNRINRLFYLPPLPAFDYGAVLNLNRIMTTPLCCFLEASAPLVALSEYAAQRLDWKLWNHLFREKADSLPRLH